MQRAHRSPAVDSSVTPLVAAGPAVGLHRRTVAQLKAALTELGVAFGAHDLKATLVDRLAAALAEADARAHAPAASAAAAAPTRRRRSQREPPPLLEAPAAAAASAPAPAAAAAAAASSSSAGPSASGRARRSRSTRLSAADDAAAAGGSSAAAASGRRGRGGSASRGRATRTSASPAAPRRQVARAPRAPGSRLQTGSRVARVSGLSAHAQQFLNSFPHSMFTGFSDESSDASSVDSRDQETDGLPQRSESEESDDDTYWRLAHTASRALSDIHASLDRRLGANPSDAVRQQLASLAEQGRFLSGQLNHNHRLHYSGGLRFKRDAKRQLMSPASVQPATPPIHMAQLVALVSKMMKSYNFLDLTSLPSTPSGMEIQYRRSAFESAAQPIEVSAASASSSMLPPFQAAFPAAAAAAPSTSAVDRGPYFSLLDRVPFPSAQAIAAIAALDRARLSLGPPGRVPNQRTRQQQQQMNGRAGQQDSIMAVEESASNRSPAVDRAAAAASKSHANKGAPAQSTLPPSRAPGWEEMQQLVALFGRPDVLGQCFQSSHLPLASSAAASAAAPASSSADAPIVQVGLLPIDLVLLRGQLHKVLSGSKEIARHLRPLLEPKLQALFQTLWAYILDPSQAEEWLGFPVTYPKPPPPVPIATSATAAAEEVQEFVAAPDHVQTFEDAHGGRKRVRFTGREEVIAPVTRASAAAAATSAAAASSSSPSLLSPPASSLPFERATDAPRVLPRQGLTDATRMADATLNEQRQRLAQANMMLSGFAYGGSAAAAVASSAVSAAAAASALHAPIRPPARPSVPAVALARIHPPSLMVPSFHAADSSLSSVASPTNTSMHAVNLPSSLAMPPPAVPMRDTVEHTHGVNLDRERRASQPPASRADSEVVDLTVSDGEDDSQMGQLLPLPSSASTSFTQAPRLTISSLVAQQQQQFELRNQALNHRQLQSPSASSIRSMSEYIADYQPMLAVGDRRVVYCPLCARVNVVAGESHQRPCIQCGGQLHQPPPPPVSMSQPSHARQISDVVAMEVDPPAAAAAVASSVAQSVPRVPASVTSDFSASVSIKLEPASGADAPMAESASGVVDAAAVEAAIETVMTDIAAPASVTLTDRPTSQMNEPAMPTAMDDSPSASFMAEPPGNVDAPVAAAASSAPAAAPASSLAVTRAPTPLTTLLTQAFFILLQLPQLQDPQSLLSRELWPVLAAMPPDIHDEFVEFASSLPPSAVQSELTRWVACVQSCISMRLVTLRKQDSYLRGCVRSLALFHRVNEALKLRYPPPPAHLLGAAASTPNPALDRQLFLNDAISKLENHLATDYRNHLAGLEAAAKAAREAAADAALSSALAAAGEAEARRLEAEEPSRKRMRAGPRTNSVAIGTANGAVGSPAMYPSPPVNPNAARVLHSHQFAFTSFPFLVDAASFSRILLSESTREQQELVHAEHERDHRHHRHMFGRGLHWHHPNAGALVMNVRRQHIVADTLHQIQRIAHSSDLKRPLKVVFANEEGIDAGGVSKEYFALLVRDLFSPDFNMFLEETGHSIFNPMSLYQPGEGAASSAASSAVAISAIPLRHQLNSEALSTLNEYELVGIVLGLSIYNGIQLEVRFPPIVYKKLLAKSRASPAAAAAAAVDPLLRPDGGVGSQPAAHSAGGDRTIPEYSLGDLFESHPDLAKGLQQLLAYPATSSAELEETFGLDFTIAHLVFGSSITRELVPGGSQIPVTLENRAAYVDAYVRYILHDSIALQFDAFATGFFKVVAKRPLELLTHPADLELLICGNQAPNWPELESAASYDGWHAHGGLVGVGGRPTAPVISHFWTFFHSLTVDLKLKLLAFVTGSNRIPIKGLKHAKFVLLPGGDNQDKLPESHTCFGQLVLPNYKSAEVLRSKFMLALAEGGTGFQLK